MKMFAGIAVMMHLYSFQCFSSVFSSSVRNTGPTQTKPRSMESSLLLPWLKLSSHPSLFESSHSQCRGSRKMYNSFLCLAYNYYLVFMLERRPNSTLSHLSNNTNLHLLGRVWYWETTRSFSWTHLSISVPIPPIKILILWVECTMITYGSAHLSFCLCAIFVKLLFACWELV